MRCPIAAIHDGQLLAVFCLSRPSENGQKGWSLLAANHPIQTRFAFVHTPCKKAGNQLLDSRKMTGGDVSRIQLPEGELLNVLDDLGALAWRRYGSRKAQTWNGCEFVEVPGGLPWVAFRFAKEDEATMKRLEAAVSSYGGPERWLLIAHIRAPLTGTNWMVCLERSGLFKRQAANANLPVWQYLERVDPGYLRLAFEDFNGLTAHVKACLDLHKL